MLLGFNIIQSNISKELSTGMGQELSTEMHINVTILCLRAIKYENELCY